MIRRLRRWKARLDLARIDADVAGWYVDDGQLSEEPLDGPLSPTGREMRERRRAAVRRLGRVGGRDPNPQLLRSPTAMQRDGYARRRASC